MHDNRILHRDIKPENILIQGFLWKISDFGCSKQLRDKNLQANTILGTQYYSPISQNFYLIYLITINY
ncbi:protein kinase, putative [Ichthyophthirius multifiliis]|uniref:Protein kinase, putative n=1 Tax=Ichthyophthirius multifiliis TaxID=5932 RepID=G0QUL2_ICHMU|nr:protein kinase, putative [Ichthyophthirius multifiliis]EGR31096.1 protein kinase, putative [Ichthyophthirius multifiliis]|eukprot:XP_004034582.1 protein kinase, putative [Ichthyophthirius multifiliis]